MNGESMLPTLKPGDVLTIVRDSVTPKLFDIIIFRHPQSGDQLLAMRVIGLAGDQIEFRADALYRNGKALDLPAIGVKYSNPKDIIYHYGTDAKYLVPSGTVFVIGDNLLNAADSRVFGPVSDKDILGVALPAKPRQVF
jgi:signal peptidase I